MKTLVVGMGLSGRSAASYLLEINEKVIAVDSKKKVLCQSKEIQDLEKRGLEFYESCDGIDFDDIKEVVVSPGINPLNPIYKKAKELNKNILGEVELAARKLCDKYWIGVTGTNGKTTTTLLIEKILNDNFKPAKALGNIGLPLCSILSEVKNEIMVVELSSYQLETLTTKTLESAVILNITFDHLDRYESMKEYAKAKFQIIEILKPNSFVYIFEAVLDEWPFFVKSEKIRSFGYLPTSFVNTDLTFVYVNGTKVGFLPTSLQGKKSHHVENFLAAFCVAFDLGLEPFNIEKSYNSFEKPSHRIEFVKEINQVKFFDDSKGTNIDATIRAVETFDEKIILIAGGVHKGSSYKNWIKPFQNKVKAIYAIGESKNLIQQDIGHFFPVYLCKNLECAVGDAFKESFAGDVILLSPGCSSFDMFKDYAHRGEEFKKCVFKLYENLSNV
jgi:UDP-N-acetylmuramoylalanine--D-glutamate ligase